MSPAEGGFMRLDKETGAVAMCARKDGEWVCEPVTDRTKSTTEASKLEAENQLLKDRIKDLEKSLETGTPRTGGDSSSGPPDGKMQLPTEEEVDKALDYVERMFKKFRDRLQKMDPNTPPSPKGDGSGAL